jgi:hypothetical protein
MAKQLEYGPGDKIYDDAISTRNVLIDQVCGNTLTSMNFRTKQDKFGNQSLVPISTSAGQATYKASDAIMLINACAVAKLRPIVDNSVSQQEGFNSLINSLQG